MIKFNFISILFLLSSCSFFLKGVDKEEYNFKLKPKIEKTYCITKSPLHYYSSNIGLVNGSTFRPSENFYLNIVNMTNYQMLFRPDIASPTAEVQYVIYDFEANSLVYKKYNLNSDEYPLYAFLGEIVTSYKLPPLKSIMSSVDQTSNYLDVNDEFADFLKKNKGVVYQNEVTLKDNFYRGGEPLKPGEKFKRTELKNLNIPQPKTDMPEGQLFLQKQNSEHLIHCNFNLEFYENSNFQVAEKEISSLTFGFFQKNKLFLASVSNNHSFETIPKTQFIKSKKHENSPAICIIESKTDKSRYFLMSDLSRDPGQHLFHLLKLKFYKSKNLAEVDHFIKNSRHLFLTDPVRLIYESQRGSEENLKELLKVNLPIYNANQLGRINAFYFDDKSHGFVLDDRYEGYLNCK